MRYTGVMELTELIGVLADIATIVAFAAGATYVYRNRQSTRGSGNVQQSQAGSGSNTQIIINTSPGVENVRVSGENTAKGGKE